MGFTRGERERKKQKTDISDRIIFFSSFSRVELFFFLRKEDEYRIRLKSRPENLETFDLSVSTLDGEKVNFVIEA